MRELSMDELDKVVGGGGDAPPDSTLPTTGYDSNFIWYINYATNVVIVKKQSTSEIRTFSIEEFEALRNKDSMLWYEDKNED